MPLTQVQSGMMDSTAQYYSFKNRIINGAMVIDQRNAGAPLTVNTGNPFFPVDRWVAYGQSADGVFTVQQSSVAPAGFNNSIVATVTTADSSIGATQYYLIGQRIEGYNFADFGFGAAGASSFTMSFWVRSSVTGSFGVAFENDAENRGYGALYTINAANTWEYKTITVPGDTTGTWLKTNGKGLNLWFSLGIGSSYSVPNGGSWSNAVALGVTGQTNLISTNGATFYITGVQLEKGSTATSFDYRPYGTELQLCQRYFIRYGNGGAAYTVGAPYLAYPLFDQNTIPSGACFAIAQLPVELRTTNPTFTAYKAFNGSTADLSNTNWQPFYTTFNNQRSVAIQKITNSMTTNQTTIVLDFDLSAEL